jgi:hypothetical protein
MSQWMYTFSPREKDASELPRRRSPRIGPSCGQSRESRVTWKSIHCRPRPNSEWLSRNPLSRSPPRDLGGISMPGSISLVLPVEQNRFQSSSCEWSLTCAVLKRRRANRAHGFGADKTMGLAHYAETFAAAGYACIVFDYRRWGASGTYIGLWTWQLTEGFY